MTALWQRPQWTCAIVFVIALFAFVGCAKEVSKPKDRARVAGKVTFGGQPLPAGTVTFKSANSPLSTPASISQGGVYSTDRAPLGKNTVSIDTSSIQYGNPAAYVRIPAKYNDPSTSGFTVDVHPGNNDDVNFALEK